MSKLHELVFKIDGILSNTTKKSFKDMNKNISSMSDKLKRFEKLKINTEKYSALTKKIDTTKNSLHKAAQESEKFRNEFEKNKATTETLKKTWQEAEHKVDDLAMSIAKAEKPTIEMRSALAVAKLEAKKAKDEFKESAKATDELERKYKNASSTVKVLNGNLEKEQENLNKVRKSLADAGISSENFERKQEELARKSEKLQKIRDVKSKASQAWEDAKSKGKDFMMSGAKLAATVTVPLKFAIDSESTMADIAKVVDFDNIAEKAGFETKMREKLSKELPMDFKSYGELISNAAGAGIKKSELLNFSEDSAKMSVAFDIEAGEAGEKMAKWRSAFHMNQKEVVSLADKINYLSNNSAATAPAISNIVSRVGALGGVAGMSAGDVAAVGTSMVSMGVGEEVGATAIKKLATTLTKGESATKGQISAFEKLGMSSSDIAKNMQKDAKTTIIQVLENIRKLPKEAQAATLTQLFGEESVQAIAPLLTNLDLLKQQFGNVDESAGKFRGSMEQEFKIRSDTAANKLQLLKNNMNNIMTLIGQALLPSFVEMTTKLAKVAEKVEAFANKHPKLVKAIIKTAFAVAGLIVAFKGLMFVKSIITAIMATTELFFTVLSANPVALIIGAIVFALYELYKHWDVVKKYVLLGIKIIVKKFNWFKNKVTNHFLAVRQAGQKVGETIKNAFEKAINWVPNKIKEIKDGILGIGSKVKNFFFGGGGNDNKNHVGAYASGGIIKRPELAMVGEGGSHEAIIPLDGSNNAYKLWQYAGQRLGALSDVNPGSSAIIPSKSTGATTQYNNDGQTFIINLTVNVDADEDTDMERKLENAILKASPRLKSMLQKMLEDIKRDRKRLSYDY